MPKFIVGSTFTYRDRYGDWHECTVKSKDETKATDHWGNPIIKMTYTYPTLGRDREITVELEHNDIDGEFFYLDTNDSRIALKVTP